MKIESILAYEILASGGFPTIEVTVVLDNGARGIASVPYGVSAGSHEATVLTDDDPTRWLGKGMLDVVNTIKNEIFPAIKDIPAEDQLAIDTAMIRLDGTPTKSKLGGNAILSVSLAVARAVSTSQGKELYQYIADTFDTKPDYTHLPQPMVVVIEGGKHADETTDLQEFCITAVGEGTVAENLRKTMEAYHQLKIILKEQKLSTNVGNEGAFAPNGIPSNEAPFAYIVDAIKRAGYEPGKDLAISIDAAASEFFKNGLYDLTLEKKIMTSAELSAFYEAWLPKYPFVTVEDLFDEDDWEAWTMMNKKLRARGLRLVGDDLTVTSISRLRKAIEMDAISAIIIKPNQIGTLSETVACCKIAAEHDIWTITSHRGGGETNDTFISDLAVAVGSKFVKVGPTRGERICKYNRLLEIERNPPK